MLNGGEGAEDSGPFAVFNMATASVAMPPAMPLSSISQK